MFNIIQFYDEHHSAIVPYILDGEVKVIFNNEEKYPYQLIVNRRINYKHQIVPANIEWSFNPYYQTLNINDFNQQLYQAMFSLKLMNFPNDLTKYLCVRAKVIDQVIEVYTLKKNEIFSFQEMKNLPKEQFKQIFSLYFKEANLSDAQLKCFFKSLSLLVNNVDVYIDEVINSKVVEAYKLGNMLNR